jgi:hypothetical protein
LDAERVKCACADPQASAEESSTRRRAEPASSEGWELVAVTGNGVAYLKREIPAPPKAGRRRTYELHDQA